MSDTPMPDALEDAAKDAQELHTVKSEDEGGVSDDGRVCALDEAMAILGPGASCSDLIVMAEYILSGQVITELLED